MIDFLESTVSSRFNHTYSKNREEMGLTAISATRGLTVLTIALLSFVDAIAKSPHATFKPGFDPSNAGKDSSSNCSISFCCSSFHIET